MFMNIEPTQNCLEIYFLSFIASIKHTFSFNHIEKSRLGTIQIMHACMLSLMIDTSYTFPAVCRSTI